MNPPFHEALAAELATCQLPRGKFALLIRKSVQKNRRDGVLSPFGLNTPVHRTIDRCSLNMAWWEPAPGKSYACYRSDAGALT
jgi:hypothetical protein